MSIFSRGSKKRKDFVKDKMQETNNKTDKTYTEKEANEEYMEKKKEWANEIISTLKGYCEVLCDPRAVWIGKSDNATGCTVFWRIQTKLTGTINYVMSYDAYKNVTQGGRSYKYLNAVQDETAKLLAKSFDYYTDSENLKSSMQSCGKGLSKLKHPIGSTALVKVGKAGKRIVDYVDELAHLMKNDTVKENVSVLVKLEDGDEWPADKKDYHYATVKTKYAKL